jgi:Ssp1 endopeptidase immunity protein Rap1a
MKTLFAAFLALTAMHSLSAQAVQMASPKSNKMVKLCSQGSAEESEAVCQAFVEGVAGATAFYGAAQQMALPFCIPSSTTGAELVSVYRTFLDDNHALRQFSAAGLAIAAFRAQYPCE